MAAPGTQISQLHYNLSTSGGYTMGSQLMSPSKDNPVTLCRYGQETVTEIICKAQEVFNLLKASSMQLPNNITFHGNQYTERKGKLAEQLQQVTMNFRRLRHCYSKVNEICDQMEQPADQDIIPMSSRMTDRVSPYTDLYVMEQHKEMVEQVELKNQQLKEIIDTIRSIIWEINTMITMRKT